MILPDFKVDGGISACYVVRCEPSLLSPFVLTVLRRHLLESRFSQLPRTRLPRPDLSQSERTRNRSHLIDYPSLCLLRLLRFKFLLFPPSSHTSSLQNHPNRSLNLPSHP